MTCSNRNIDISELDALWWMMELWFWKRDEFLRYALQTLVDSWPPNNLGTLCPMNTPELSKTAHYSDRGSAPYWPRLGGSLLRSVDARLFRYWCLWSHRWALGAECRSFIERNVPIIHNLLIYLSIKLGNEGTIMKMASPLVELVLCEPATLTTMVPSSVFLSGFWIARIVKSSNSSTHTGMKATKHSSKCFWQLQRQMHYQILITRR